MVGEEQGVSDPCDPDPEPRGREVLVHQEHQEGDRDEATFNGDEAQVPCAQESLRDRIELHPTILQVMEGEEAVRHVRDSDPSQDAQEGPVIEIHKGPFSLYVAADLPAAPAYERVAGETRGRGVPAVDRVAALRVAL